MLPHDVSAEISNVALMSMACLHIYAIELCVLVIPLVIICFMGIKWN